MSLVHCVASNVTGEGLSRTVVLHIEYLVNVRLSFQIGSIVALRDMIAAVACIAAMIGTATAQEDTECALRAQR